MATRKAPQELPDDELIRRILSGEPQLFEQIVRRYNARLFRIGMALLADPADAEDAMQSAYIKAYEHLQDFEGRAQLGTWLTRILINECKLQLKRKNQQAMMQKAESSGGEKRSGIAAQQPENVAINKELKKLLEEALAALPEKYRIVFVMREIEGMTTAETMAVLELSESNVKARLSRARAMLRDRLSSYYRNDLVFHFPLNDCDNMVQRVFEQLNIRQ